jgi:hypothetical protein
MQRSMCSHGASQIKLLSDVIAADLRWKQVNGCKHLSNTTVCLIKTVRD